MYISVQAYKKFIFSTESCVHFLFPLQLMAWWKNNDHMLIFPPVIAHSYGTLYGTYKTEGVDWNFTVLETLHIVVLITTNKWTQKP